MARKEIVLCAAALALLAASATARADEDRGTVPPTETDVKPPGGEGQQMYQFYAGNTPGDTGQFDGKIVCLRADRKFTTAPAEECGSKNRIYALDLDDVDLTHPLLAGSERVEDELQQNLGRAVTVQGRYYESTGMILAGGILPKQ
jgi:hypothetical protein